MEVTSGGRRGNSGFFFRLELVANFIAIDKGSEKFKSSVSVTQRDRPFTCAQTSFLSLFTISLRMKTRN